LLDTAEYFDTSSEPYIALQMAEMAVAAANYSVNALAYWALGDSPPEPNGTCNRWGAFRWTDEDSFSARYHWYVKGHARTVRYPCIHGQ